ncbi:hypothetical protein KKD60_01395 [Patescibacteria group bacterium]|nr:hypothetical protein [Patescibacteria group bacterium]
MLFWMTLNRHEIPASVIFQSDTAIADLANNIVNQSFNNFIVVILTMSAIHCLLKNKESLIMEVQCLCGQKFTLVINTSANYGLGQNFNCPECTTPYWFDEQTRRIILLQEPDPAYFEKIVRTKN